MAKQKKSANFCKYCENKREIKDAVGSLPCRFCPSSPFALPLRVSEFLTERVEDANGKEVFRAEEVTAALIVRAVNAHAALVEVARNVVKDWERHGDISDDDLEQTVVEARHALKSAGEEV